MSLATDYAVQSARIGPIHVPVARQPLRPNTYLPKANPNISITAKEAPMAAKSDTVTWVPLIFIATLMVGAVAVGFNWVRGDIGELKTSVGTVNSQLGDIKVGIGQTNAKLDALIEESKKHR